MVVQGAVGAITGGLSQQGRLLKLDTPTGNDVLLKAGQLGDTNRRFLKGDALPSVIVHEPRRLAMLDAMMGTRQHAARVAWELVAYFDQA